MLRGWITLLAIPALLLLLPHTEGRADNTHLIRQKQVLQLYIGLFNAHNYEHEHFDFSQHLDHFYKPEAVKIFLHVYHRGLLPYHGIFSTNDKRTMQDTLLLFDVFYFAKDFETFYKVACWARQNIHPVQFIYAYTLAIFHRDDCHTFLVPPLYEITPNYYTPVETMHEAFNAKIAGLKGGKFPYNNTGYEYNYLENKFGGPLSPDANGHSEYLVSYVREDIGLNSWFLLNMFKYPYWMEPEKYGGSHWYKRGENFYYTLQQLFAMYTLQRLSNKMPYVEILEWDKPIKVGYDPRVTYVNGKPLYHRPDYVVPKESNTPLVSKALLRELRLKNGIHSEKIWDTENSTLIPLDRVDGTDLLARMVFGMPHVPNGRFFGNYFAESLKALGYVPKLGSERELAGTALSAPITALRDPAFYQFLARLIKLFQSHKKHYPPYTPKELSFTGVAVKDFEVDKFLTYFERFSYEVTNAMPLPDAHDFDHYEFYAEQHRLNHKPYTYKVKVHSDIAHEAMIRVFIGPKYDAEERLLHLEQSRLSFVELDRFVEKLKIGDNLFERYSKESPLFSQDPVPLRHFYAKLKKAMKNAEPYYVSEGVYSGIPDRFQLPRGRKDGQAFVIAVVVTPYKHGYHGEEKHFYATMANAKCYDALPLGFPFDRPVHSSHFHVPNILFKDVLVYHHDHYVEYDVRISDEKKTEKDTY